MIAAVWRGTEQQDCPTFTGPLLLLIVGMQPDLVGVSCFRCHTPCVSRSKAKPDTLLHRPVARCRRESVQAVG